MAPNKTKICGCCGRKGHTLLRCSLPGAKLLLQLRRAAAPARRAKVARKVVKTRVRKQNSKKYKASRARLYSGPKVVKTVKATPPHASTYNACGSTATAYAALLEAGYLSKPPKLCPKCNGAFLDSPKEFLPGYLHSRCADHVDCGKRHNVTSFGALGAAVNLRSWELPSLHAAVVMWTSDPRKAPLASAVSKVLHLSVDKLLGLYHYLLSLEAAAGRRFSAAGMLHGDVEGDGTLVRVTRISEANPNYKKEVLEAQTKLRASSTFRTIHKSRMPKVWNGQMRMVGLLERNGGKLLLKELPIRLVPPGAPPPPESAQDLSSTSTMKHVAPGCCLFTDSAHAWRQAVLKHNQGAVFGKSRINYNNLCVFFAFASVFLTHGINILVQALEVDGCQRLPRKVFVARTALSTLR
jgi:hypothetical protein